MGVLCIHHTEEIRICISKKEEIVMKTIKIPYYKETLDLHVAEENLKAVITAKMHEFKAEKSEAELVEEALANPIESKTLSELAVGKNKVVIVTSDHTRAVPSKLTLPILLKEIRKGNPDADITILIATGLHRPTTEEEQRNMFGDAIVDNEKIVANNAFDPEQFVKVCDLPSGAEFFCNSPISSLASQAEERASFPVSATPQRLTRTTATRQSPALTQEQACLMATLSIKTW